MDKVFPKFEGLDLARFDSIVNKVSQGGFNFRETKHNYLNQSVSLPLWLLNNNRIVKADETRASHNFNWQMELSNP